MSVTKSSNKFLVMPTVCLYEDVNTRWNQQFSDNEM